MYAQKGVPHEEAPVEVDIGELAAVLVREALVELGSFQVVL